MPLIVKCNNGIVTDRYLEIIGEALLREHKDVRYTNCFSDALKENKKEVIVVARTIEAFKLLIKGFKNVIVWYQGVEPEESFMAHGSKLRFWILSCMERYILKKNKFSIFVSEEMHNHYERKYNIKIRREMYYCMPCMNTEIHKEAFLSKRKYSDNIFAYIGSLAVWQKFEETVKIYKKIEESGLSNCKLKVYTSQIDEAKKIIENQCLKNYEIGFVANNELPKALGDVKYGFIIRENTTVNRVATPTKISTYLSCGLIPVYSECISDFSLLAQNMKYALKCDAEIVKHINEFASQEIDYRDVYSEYQSIFESHYSQEYHIKRLGAYKNFRG